MKYEANSPEDYIAQLPEDRQAAMKQLRQTIKDHLPEGFEEQMSYGMIGYVVPHSLYPNGYHCDPKLPLPFISIASQKNFVALYHSGIYASKDLLDWFTEAYPKHSKRKLNMGKSCIRFRNVNHIPYDLIKELVGKMTAAQWIELYEGALQKK